MPKEEAIARSTSRYSSGLPIKWGNNSASAELTIPEESCRTENGGGPGYRPAVSQGKAVHPVQDQQFRADDGYPEDGKPAGNPFKSKKKEKVYGKMP